MSPRKNNAAERLDRIIGVRVSTAFYNHLESLQKDSNCQTLGEFSRMILERKEIIWYHKDASKGAMAIELSGIRRELKAIGNNVNQVTRYFNSASIPSQKIFEALKILDEFKKVSGRLNDLQLILESLNDRQGD